MIVVNLEIWPRGIEAAKRDLGTMRIWNDGTGDSEAGNYKFEIQKGREFSPKQAGKPWKTGEIKGWPRRSKRVGPWDLLLACLWTVLWDRVKSWVKKKGKNHDSQS
jgi:hypothetical protein